MAQTKQTTGRSGGRAGGAGYDYQDVYVAWQLAKMLMGGADPIVEVLWEKKTIDSGNGAESVYVDDAIVRHQSGESIYTQLKELSASWTATKLIQSGVLAQFWKQWDSTSPESRDKIRLQLASTSKLDELAKVNDAALRSRTPAELMSDEAASESIEYIKKLAKELSLSETDPALHEFLRKVGVEELPAAHHMEGWIANELAIFGEAKSNAVNQLIRIVAQSKHIGPHSRSTLTRDGLIQQLKTSGFDLNVLVAAGLIAGGTPPSDGFWIDYRKDIITKFRTFRVYGLEVDHEVRADLPSLFVPLKLLPLDDQAEKQIASTPERRSLTETLYEDEANRPSRAEPKSANELAEVLANNRRFVLVGAQGCGKTTTARWLAIIAAMDGDEGRETREQFGLPPQPLRPLFVRFRRFADWLLGSNMPGETSRA